MRDIGVNLLSEFIFFVIGILTTIFLVRSKSTRKILRRLGIKVTFDYPQLDVDLMYQKELGSTDIEIKNAGQRPAYNVYAFLFEVHPGIHGQAMANITSLGAQKVKKGVLAASEKIVFSGKSVDFEGCNAISDQEVWIEYSDEDGSHYRTVFLPSNPRDGESKINPPIIIKHRLPATPGLNAEIDKDISKLRIGKAGIPGLRYL